MENFGECNCLNIIVSIYYFSELNVTVKTTLKYYHNHALTKKTKLMGGAMNFFKKKLLVHKIFSYMVP